MSIKSYPNPRIVDEHDLGTFSTISLLKLEYPTASIGDKALVGETNSYWNWNDTLSDWENSGISSATLPTPSVVNEFLITDGESWLAKTLTQTKLILGISNVNNTSDANKNVLSASKLTTARNINGVSFDGTANITVEDSTKEPTINASSTSNYWAGDKSWKNFFEGVSSATLTGLSFLSQIPIVAEDTVLIAFGKIQAQLNKKQEYLNSGVLTQPTVSINATGLISIGSYDVLLYDNENSSGLIKKYTVPSSSLQLNQNEYTYLICSYNEGEPVSTLTTNNVIINHSNILNVSQFNWEKLGTIDEVHKFSTGNYGLGLANKISHRLIHTERFGYQDGLSLTESTGNVVNVASGSIWYDGEEFFLEQISSTPSNIHFYRHLSGAWTVSKTSTYNNSQYDDGSNLVSLNPNKYAVNWIFRGVSDDNTLYMVLGGGNYSLIEAQSSKTPITPDIIKKQSILIGRIIVENGAATATQIDKIGTDFSSSTASNHNDLSYRDVAGNHAKLIPISDTLTAIQLTKSNGTTVNLNYDSLNGKIQIGDIAGGNYTEIEEDGTVVSIGGATMFRDEYPAYILPVSGQAAPDSVSHTIGGVARQFYSFDGGNREEILSGSFEIPHDYAYGTDIEVHVHWRPSTSNIGSVKWFFDWEHSPAQSASIAKTPLSSVIVISSNEQYFHKITSIGNIVANGYSLGDKIGFNLRRSPADNEDTYGSDVLLEQIAIHVQVDTFGSRQRYIK